jgi:hypothetical protein
MLLELYLKAKSTTTTISEFKVEAFMAPLPTSELFSELVQYPKSCNLLYTFVIRPLLRSLRNLRGYTLGTTRVHSTPFQK